MTDQKRCTHIISVDVGLKNLAICVARFTDENTCEVLNLTKINVQEKKIVQSVSRGCSRFSKHIRKLINVEDFYTTKLFIEQQNPRNSGAYAMFYGILGTCIGLGIKLLFPVDAKIKPLKKDTVKQKRKSVSRLMEVLQDYSNHLENFDEVLQMVEDVQGKKDDVLDTLLQIVGASARGMI